MVEFTNTPNDPTPELDLQEIAKRLLTTMTLVNTASTQGGVYLPYFNEKTAMQVRHVIDEVARSGKSVLIPADGVLSTTLRNKFSQGKDYLLKNMDPDGEYKKLCDRVTTNMLKRGLVVRLRPSDMAETAIPIEEWRPAFLEFISKPQDVGSKFHRLGLRLSNDEMLQIIQELEPLKAQFLYDVKPTYILVIRYDTSNEYSGNPTTSD